MRYFASPVSSLVRVATGMPSSGDRSTAAPATPTFVRTPSTVLTYSGTAVWSTVTVRRSMLEARIVPLRSVIEPRRAGSGIVAVRDDCASLETAEASKPCRRSSWAPKMLKMNSTATVMVRIRRRGLAPSRLTFRRPGGRGGRGGEAGRWAARAGFADAAPTGFGLVALVALVGLAGSVALAAFGPGVGTWPAPGCLRAAVPRGSPVLGCGAPVRGGRGPEDAVGRGAPGRLPRVCVTGYLASCPAVVGERWSGVWCARVERAGGDRLLPALVVVVLVVVLVLALTLVTVVCDRAVGLGDHHGRRRHIPLLRDAVDGSVRLVVPACTALAEATAEPSPR